MLDLYFDGTPDGGWTWGDIEEFGATDPASLPQWQQDAIEDLFNEMQYDPRIAALLDAYENIPNPSQPITNAVLNQTVQVAQENAANGQYDGWVDQFEWAFGHADAWYDANGYDDPYLDWGYYDSYDYFWADDSPSWWAGEYGLY